MRYIILFLFSSLPILLHSQTELSNFWVELQDKHTTAYSIFHPQAFLSPRALARRARLHIPIDSMDLPVNEKYLSAIAAKGVRIRHTSKWLNAVTVVTTDSLAKQLEKLDFVKKVERVGRYHQPTEKKRNFRNVPIEPYERTSGYYGYGSLQISMVNGHALHRLGYQGTGVYVGVQDGGFNRVDVMPFFDSLRVHDRLLPGKDFVDGDEYVYESASHGSSVLSVMASNLPYLYVGTAPQATYLCMKTEDVRSESITEECNWVAAIEFADSMGIDVINSSLGYTQFSEEKMNYVYEDLNGQTSRASRAAEIAFSKGVFVVNSAGNSGSGAWKFVGTPADSRGVFAIGAVTATKSRARFSSFGPTADGRIKPNISAMGQQVAVASIRGYDIGVSNGTSLSSPLIAGLVANLKQAFPHKSNEDIRLAIEQSASQATDPDNVLGYGIPDFYKAYSLLKGRNNESFQAVEVFVTRDQLELVYIAPIEKMATLAIYDWSGKVHLKRKIPAKKQFERTLLEYKLPKGVYYLVLETEKEVRQAYFVR